MVQAKGKKIVVRKRSGRKKAPAGSGRELKPARPAPEQAVGRSKNSAKDPFAVIQKIEVHGFQETLERERKFFAYNKMFKAVYDAVLIIDLEGRIQEVNQRAERNLRLERDVLLGKQIAEFIPVMQGEFIKEVALNVAKGNFTVFETTCMRGDQSFFNGEVVVYGLDDEEPDILCVFCRSIDLRERAAD